MVGLFGLGLANETLGTPSHHVGVRDTTKRPSTVLIPATGASCDFLLSSGGPGVSWRLRCYFAVF